jgi:hypothetical protein
LPYQYCLCEADRVIITEKIYRINVLENDYDNDNGDIDPSSLEIIASSGLFMVRQM